MPVFLYIIGHWKPGVYLAGMFFEIIGALMLANRYLNVRWWERLGILMSAIYNGRKAKSAKAIADLSEERTNVALRGLGFLSLGFFLRTLPSIAELFDF